MTEDLAVIASFEIASPPPDQCAGLTPPAPGKPVSAQVMMGGAREKYCRPGLADGSGNVALPTDVHYDGSSVSYSTTYFLFGASGSSLGRAGGMTMTTFSQLTGFEGVEIVGQGNGSSLRVFAPDGAITGQTTQRAEVMVPVEDPTGGIVVAVFSTGTLTGIEAFDASARLRWRAPINDHFVALGVDRAGNTLLLLDGSARYGGHKLAGLWIDTSGKPGSVFEASANDEGVDFGTAALVPRVGSGLFLARQAREHSGTVHASWLRQFDPLATSGSPAPQWLTAKPDTTLHMAHGGTAYALIDLPRFTPDCAQRIEMLADSGKSCGSLVFRAAEGACQTAGLTVGYDGTVIQQLPNEFEVQQPDISSQTCTWHWWPALLH
jgi:hypothetical protein